MLWDSLIKRETVHFTAVVIPYNVTLVQINIQVKSYYDAIKINK